MPQMMRYTMRSFFLSRNSICLKCRSFTPMNVARAMNTLLMKYRKKAPKKNFQLACASP